LDLLVLEGNRVCFLDFGLFGRLTPRQRRRMGFLLWALVQGDYETVGEQLLRLSALRPGADPDEFRDALAEVLAAWSASSQAHYSTARLLLRQLALGGRYGVVFPRELMLLARALVTTEGTAAVIGPDVTLADLARPLLPELRRALLLDPAQVEEAWRRNRFDYLELLIDLPELLPTRDRRRRERRTRPARRRHRHRHGAAAAPTSPGRPATWCLPTTTS
jgi:ubiquinone biosynthesis protein